MPTPHIAIVGAGWAGVASAITLHDLGYRVRVFESSHLLGGRARCATDSTFGTIDCGQHLFMGAYTHTLKLIDRLNPCAPGDLPLLSRVPLYLMSASQDFKFSTPSGWRPPLHLAIGLINAKGLRWRDKFKLAQCLLAIDRPPAQATVLGWLTHHKQPSVLVDKIWQPLCVAMLNTPVEHACATLFVRVLHDTLASSTRGATDLILAQTDLSSLAPQRLTQIVDCQLGHTVGDLRCRTDSIQVDGQSFDGCIVATPPYRAATLLAQSGLHQPRLASLLTELNQFTHAPITTCYLRLVAPYPLPAPMLMLTENPAQGWFGQWLFERQTHDKIARQTDWVVVISDSAQAIAHADKEALIKGIYAQLTHQLSAQRSLPPIRAYRVITEKKATFVARPGLIRPNGRTPDPRLMLAGDYTDTGYPAVVEGAVMSGLQAAQNLHLRFKHVHREQAQASQCNGAQ